MTHICTPCLLTIVHFSCRIFFFFASVFLFFYLFFQSISSIFPAPPNKMNLPDALGTVRFASFADRRYFKSIRCVPTAVLTKVAHWIHENKKTNDSLRILHVDQVILRGWHWNLMGWELWITWWLPVSPGLWMDFKEDVHFFFCQHFPMIASKEILTSFCSCLHGLPNANLSGVFRWVW